MYLACAPSQAAWGSNISQSGDGNLLGRAGVLSEQKISKKRDALTARVRLPWQQVVTRGKMKSDPHSHLVLSGPVRFGFFTIFGKTCNCDQSQKVRMFKNCDWTSFDQF
jgi:hypothetical protein